MYTSPVYPYSFTLRIHLAHGLERFVLATTEKVKMEGGVMLISKQIREITMTNNMVYFIVYDSTVSICEQINKHDYILNHKLDLSCTNLNNLYQSK